MENGPMMTHGSGYVSDARKTTKTIADPSTPQLANAPVEKRASVSGKRCKAGKPRKGFPFLVCFRFNDRNDLQRRGEDDWRQPKK